MTRAAVHTNHLSLLPILRKFFRGYILWGYIFKGYKKASLISEAKCAQSTNLLPRDGFGTVRRQGLSQLH